MIKRWLLSETDLTFQKAVNYQHRDNRQREMQPPYPVTMQVVLHNYNLCQLDLCQVQIRRFSIRRKENIKCKIVCSAYVVEKIGFIINVCKFKNNNCNFCKKERGRL